MASLLDLSDRQDLGALATLVAAIRRARPQGDLLLVGATARDILLSYAHGIAITRASYDLDFAVAVATWQDYLALRETLLADGGFREETGALHRLLLPPSTKLDLIPFGGIERDDRSIAWPPAQDEVMHVIGYREAMRDAVKIRLPGDQMVDVVSLRALLVLKLFAWRDRRARSAKDAADLRLILDHYVEAGNEDRFYTVATHLFDAADYDYKRSGAWLLGSDIRALFGDGDRSALTAVIALLAPEVAADGALLLARDMRGAAAEEALHLLAALYSGLTGEPTP